MTDQLLSLTDIKILTALQQDGRITNQTLADQIGMSASPCWRRVRQLEEHRYIQGYRAVLDRRKIGLGVMIASHTVRVAEPGPTRARPLKARRCTPGSKIPMRHLTAVNQ